jgi:hypothetical protein
MPYFPDKSPHQEVLEYVDVVRSDFQLTEDEIVIVLLQVINAIADPGESKSYELKKRRI